MGSAELQTGTVNKRRPPGAERIADAIVGAVAYVDVFDYPLTAAEIHRYLPGVVATAETVNRALDQRFLIPDRLSRVGNYYTLPGREDTVRMRTERQELSNRLWPDAVSYGRRIARLPFVQMVAVTGSLAVNNVGAHVDVDYLIVSANDHLWVCRALVILIVRQAALRGITLCPNYLVTERSLLFTEQNLYTAHEVVQMVPLHGQAVYNTLRKLNDWTTVYLPNADGPPSGPEAGRIGGANRSRVRALAEAALSTRPGLWLERWEMDRKLNRFSREQIDWAESCFSSDCCKGHFHYHQQRIISALQHQVNLTEAKIGG